MEKNILVIGDSWSIKWPEKMGVPSSHAQGIGGSMAYDWASDTKGVLTKAKNTSSDCVIISLGGNDLMHAASKGKSNAMIVYNLYHHIKSVIKAFGKKEIFLIKYTDPFFGKNLKYKVVMFFANLLVDSLSIKFGCYILDTQEWLTERHFDGKDIHPWHNDGIAVMAENIKKRLS
jgi:hypothetical protein